MTYDTANKLAAEIKASEEYKTYKALAEVVKADATTVALIKEYHQLQVQIQTMMYTGKKDDEKLERFQKIGELLQMKKEVSDYLIAEFRLHTLVSDIYKIIADAADIDLSNLEA